MIFPLLFALWSPEALADGPCGTPDCQIAQDMGQALSGTTADWFTVPEGQITFDVEGTEGGPYHSRTLHWPGGASGVTIGRGYDMKYRTAAEVRADMIAAGVDPETASGLARGAGLEGRDASYFVNTHDYELTPEQQYRLFASVYADYEDMTKDLVCDWSGNSGAACDSLWSGLEPAIRTMLVDLRYRGDLTSGRWSSTLRSSVMANDLDSFASVMGDRARWYGVPEDRFNRRATFIADAAAESTSAAPAVTDAQASPLAPAVSPRATPRPQLNRRFRRGRS